jgi:GT2 family glycosyltransferase
MNLDWNLLDPETAGMLLAASCGTGHLSAVAGRCLDRCAAQPEQAPVYARLALDALLAAWAWSPLDGRAAGQVLALLGPEGDHLAKPLAAMVAQASRPDPEAQRTIQRTAGLLTRGRLDQARDLLATALTRDPLNATLLHQVLDLGLRRDELAWAEGLLSRPWPPAAAPLQAAVRADLAFFRQDYEQAAQLYGLALSTGAFPALRAKRAESLLRLGARSAALGEYRTACREMPWNAGVLLRLHDLALGLDRETAQLAVALDQAAAPPPAANGEATEASGGSSPDTPGSTAGSAAGSTPGSTTGDTRPATLAILLYSYNKADELDATLAALSRADLGEARIHVLANGCTDHTAAVLDGWQGRLGARLARMDLPVNVGAPAARNWLLNAVCAGLPDESSASPPDFVAYLDDDALPPADWLGRLGAAVRRYPRASAWGCKVVDAALPRIIQSADLHLKPGLPPDPASPYTMAPANGDPELTPGQIRTTDAHLETLDFGQFDTLRPCLSATGCCHLFRTAELRAAGGFDIRFSPSQYDDLDRDLSSSLAGKPVAYIGHLTVPHLKRTGEAAKTSQAATGNGLGNRHKLNHKHRQAAVERLLAFDLATMIADVETKQETLREFGL